MNHSVGMSSLDGSSSSNGVVIKSSAFAMEAKMLKNNRNPKIEENFIDRGSKVEITTSLPFRKRDLKGLQAKVILPLDQDDELGLEFLEEIGAGSLDGYGKDKKCLYVHRKHIEKVSD